MTAENRDRVPLLDEFPVPTYDEWSAAASRELRGRSLDEFRWEPDEGIELPALFTRRDIEDLPHLASGARGLLVVPRACAIRQCIDAAEPTMAARLCEQALASGADELLVRLDRLARHGVDPGIVADSDSARIEFDAGDDGCAIYHANALAEVLRDVDLGRTRIAFDAGASSLAVLGMLRSIARERDHDGDLNVELGLDPIGELARGPTPGMAIDTLIAEWSAARDVTPFAIHSSVYHHAGATAVQELACTIATAIAYLRSMAATPIDDAVRAICLRMAVHTDIYEEIAKLRAVRLLWAKVAREFGATDLQVTVHAESSDRSRSEDDVHTNLLRSNLQAFIAALSGCDSTMLAPFDTSHDQRDEHAQALARNQLILLREEAMMQRVQDPCGGSFAVEVLTDRLARGAWDLVQEIEDRGGMIAALSDGFVQARIAAAGARRLERIRTGSRNLVGTTRFADPKFRKAAPSLPDSETLRQSHLDFVAETRGPTIGELTRANRGDGWLELEHPLLRQAPEGLGFETLRRTVLDASIDVLPVLVGSPKLARTRHEFARDFFTVGGFHVLEPAPSYDGTHGAGIVVLCGEDSVVNDLAPQLDGEFLLCVAGPPRPELSDRVDAFVHRGCDALRVLRDLYLSSEVDEA